MRADTLRPKGEVSPKTGHVLFVNHTKDGSGKWDMALALVKVNVTASLTTLVRITDLLSCRSRTELLCSKCRVISMGSRSMGFRSVRRTMRASPGQEIGAGRRKNLDLHNSGLKLLGARTLNRSHSKKYGDQRSSPDSRMRKRWESSWVTRSRPSFAGSPSELLTSPSADTLCPEKMRRASYSGSIRFSVRSSFAQSLI
jgi:hypothetical protein